MKEILELLLSKIRDPSGDQLYRSRIGRRSDELSERTAIGAGGYRTGTGRKR